MYAILLTIHVTVCVLIVLIVLVQAGRSGGLSGFLGAGGSDSLFSASSQQTGLRKFTVVLALLFFCTSFGLTILNSRAPKTVLGRQFPSLPPIQKNNPDVPSAPQMPAGPANPTANTGAPKSNPGK
jgi:preprotein translocase subunit SecG